MKRESASGTRCDCRWSSNDTFTGRVLCVESVSLSIYLADTHPRIRKPKTPRTSRQVTGEQNSRTLSRLGVQRNLVELGIFSSRAQFGRCIEKILQILFHFLFVSSLPIVSTSKYINAAQTLIERERKASKSGHTTAQTLFCVASAFVRTNIYPSSTSCRRNKFIENKNIPSLLPPPSTSNSLTNTQS